MKATLGYMFLGMLVLSTPAHSQTQPPDPVTLQASDHYCGHATQPVYCYGIPLTNGGSSAGTVWLDIYANNTGFVVFNMTGTTPPLQTTAYITGAVRSTNSIGQTTAITVTFAGTADPDMDGDVDNTLSGSLTLYFKYVYVPTQRFYLLYVVAVPSPTLALPPPNPSSSQVTLSISS